MLTEQVMIPGHLWMNYKLNIDMIKPALELCVASTKAIQIAKKYPFDRIELCQNLENGGTTPSLGLIHFATTSGLNTHVLIRPRAGNFIYTPEEIQVMLTDVKRCNLTSIKGLVVGSLTENHEIDVVTICKMMETVEDLDFTFHRAFDDITDWKKAMDQLIKLRFKRILTSGGQANVDLGKERLKEMVKYANGRIEIMIGGGIRPDNILSLTNEIVPTAIHFSGTSMVKNSTSKSLFSTDQLEIDEEKVKLMVQNLKRI